MRNLASAICADYLAHTASTQMGRKVAVGDPVISYITVCTEVIIHWTSNVR